MSQNSTVAADSVVLVPEALETNRTGLLTTGQRRSWRQVVQSRRKGIRSGAWVAAALGVLLLFADGPASKRLAREAVGVGCLVVSVLILAVAPNVGDALSKDVREGRVETIEGAIAKHMETLPGGRPGSTTFFVDVAGRRLRTGRDWYEKVPDVGIVRAFYLPRSGRLINLERLPDRPLPESPVEARQQVLGQFTDAIRTHDRVAFAEARAGAASFLSEMKQQIEGPATPAPDQAGDQRALMAGLPGSWTNPLLTVTFSPDGTFNLAMIAGPPRRGQWRVDPHGRLIVTDDEGRVQIAEARLSHDQLIVWLQGERLTMTRQPS